MRMLLAGILAFAISAVVGRFLIPALRAMKAGQSIKEIGPNWHMSKQGTPTMGGIMFMVACVAAVLVFGWRDMAGGDFSALFVLVLALLYGAIGFVDDYAKIKKKENTGLTAGWKFLLQLAVAIAFLALMRMENHLTPNLYIPFVNVSVSLPWIVYLIFAAFVMVGCVNAVNLTDGLDGLAGSVTLPVAVFFAVLSAWWDKGAVGIFAGALAGGVLGFLVYNFYPAKVFMGDTGSLFLGGAVCPGRTPHPHPRGHHLHCGDHERHSPGGLLQAHPWQADLPHGSPPPPSGDGGLERGAHCAHLRGHYHRLLPAGLCGRDVSVQHVSDGRGKKSPGCQEDRKTRTINTGGDTA